MKARMRGGRHALEAVLSVAGEGTTKGESESMEAKEKGVVEGCARTHPQRHWEAGVSGRDDT